MSRSGYGDGDCDDEIGMLISYGWQANVRRAVRGKKGQAFLKELRNALDSLPERELIASAFESDGAYCALGSLGRYRGLDSSAMPEYAPENDLDYDYGETAEAAAKAFKTTKVLAAEIMDANDDNPHCFERPFRDETPQERWLRMRNWVAKRIREWEWPTTLSQGASNGERNG